MPGVLWSLHIKNALLRPHQPPTAQPQQTDTPSPTHRTAGKANRPGDRPGGAGNGGLPSSCKPAGVLVWLFWGSGLMCFQEAASLLASGAQGLRGTPCKLDSLTRPTLCLVTLFSRLQSTFPGLTYAQGTSRLPTAGTQGTRERKENPGGASFLSTPSPISMNDITIKQSRFY